MPPAFLAEQLAGGTARSGRRPDRPRRRGPVTSVPTSDDGSTPSVSEMSDSGRNPLQPDIDDDATLDHLLRDAGDRCRRLLAISIRFQACCFCAHEYDSTTRSLRVVTGEQRGVDPDVRTGRRAAAPTGDHSGASVGEANLDLTFIDRVTETSTILPTATPGAFGVPASRWWGQWCEPPGGGGGSRLMVAEPTPEPGAVRSDRAAGFGRHTTASFEDGTVGGRQPCRSEAGQMRIGPPYPPGPRRSVPRRSTAVRPVWPLPSGMDPGTVAAVRRRPGNRNVMGCDGTERCR